MAYILARGVVERCQDFFIQSQSAYGFVCGNINGALSNDAQCVKFNRTGREYGLSTQVKMDFGNGAFGFKACVQCFKRLRGRPSATCQAANGRIPSLKYCPINLCLQGRNIQRAEYIENFRVMY